LTITLAPETLESRSRAPKTRISSVQLVLFAVVWPAWKLLGVDDENVQQFPPQSYDQKPANQLANSVGTHRGLIN